MRNSFRLIAEEEVRRLLSVAVVEQVTRDALADLSSRRIRQPVRTVLANGNASGVLAIMPCCRDTAKVFSTKLVSVFPGNHARGLDSHQATILLHDATDGRLLAIVDGRLITEMRTAAASAAASRALAVAGRHEVAIIGSGVQARAHARALAHALEPSRIHLWSRSRERALELARTIESELRIAVSLATSADAAVASTTVAVSATAATEPVISSRALHAGLHLNAVGACTPRSRELASEVVERAAIFVDSMAGALSEAGDLLIPYGASAAEHIAGEIGDVFAGRLPGRQSPEQITIFKSLGVAAEDLSVAHWVYQQACEQGVGTVCAV